MSRERRCLASILSTNSLAVYTPLPPCLIRLVNWSSRSQTKSDPLQSSLKIDSSKSNAETDPIWGSRLAPVQKDHWSDQGADEIISNNVCVSELVNAFFLKCYVRPVRHIEDDMLHVVSTSRIRIRDLISPQMRTDLFRMQTD